MTPRTVDVCVVGAGVTGCSVARELCRSALSVLVLEAAEDVCCGTSKANSGIVHAGFDARPGTLMAAMNVEGARLMPALCDELSVPYVNNGSLVLCFDEAGVASLERLRAQGVENGVEGLEVVSCERLRAIEPTVSPSVVAALWAPTAGIVDPFVLTSALAENAAENGCAFSFGEAVRAVRALPEGAGYEVETDGGAVRARAVVNAAGVFSGELYNASLELLPPGRRASLRRLSITPRRGSYLLLDKTAAPVPARTLFQLPTDKGKGVLVAPTCHGNTLVGPTAVDVDDPLATETSAAELDDVREKALLSVPGLPLGAVITSFAGLRAHEEGHEFVLGQTAPGYFHAAGIESPGLTSAPAIGRLVAAQVAEYLGAGPREGFSGARPAPVRPAELPFDERVRLLGERPSYGRVVCRCEEVTLGEIEDAFARPVPPTTLDGLKRRLRVGMGRCQGGFCLPRALEALAQEQGVGLADVRKSGPGSWVACGPTKDFGPEPDQRAAACDERSGS